MYSTTAAELRSLARDSGRQTAAASRRTPHTRRRRTVGSEWAASRQASESGTTDPPGSINRRPGGPACCAPTKASRAGEVKPTESNVFHGGGGIGTLFGSRLGREHPEKSGDDGGAIGDSTWRLFDCDGGRVGRAPRRYDCSRAGCRGCGGGEFARAIRAGGAVCKRRFRHALNKIHAISAGRAKRIAGHAEHGYEFPARGGECQRAASDGTLRTD